MSSDGTLGVFVDTTILWDSDTLPYNMLYLSRFVNSFQKGSYTDIDSFKIYAPPINSRDGGLIAFVHCDDSCCYLISGTNMLDLDTLIYESHLNRCTWMNLPVGMQLNVTESLLIVQDICIQDTTNIYYVIRIQRDNTCDTLIRLNEAFYPGMSSSADEVFFSILGADQEKTKSTLNIAIYDVLADSFSVPLVSNYFDGPAFRPDKRYPLVFLRRDSRLDKANICMITNSGELSYVTQLKNNQWLGRWYMAGDSLSYVIKTEVNSKTIDSTRVMKFELQARE